MEKKVLCPFEGCSKYFRVRTSFSSHISRKHMLSKSVHEERPQEICYADRIQGQDTVNTLEDKDSQNDEEKFLNQLAMFYLKMQAKMLLPASTIQCIIEEFQDLHSYGLHNVLDKLSDKLHLMFHKKTAFSSICTSKKNIANTYPQTFADFTDKGEKLGSGHYSLLRSIKCRVEHVNRDNVAHRLRQPKRIRIEGDCISDSPETSHKEVRCLSDRYGCINWQPVQLPEGETQGSLEDKKNTLQLINSCPSLLIAEIQEQWPFLFTLYGMSSHFKQLTGIDIGERIEGEGDLSNNKVAITAVVLMMKHYNEKEDSLFLLADETSTKMSIEAERNLPITPRLIILGRSLMTATSWMVSAEGRIIFELDKENTFADALSVFFASFYVLNLEYQEAACTTLELIQRFFVRINPEEGTKCTSKVGTSRKTGNVVKRKVVQINPHVTTFLQRLTEFEWKTSN
uniref:C2H2-type domain-containing protein n=1 Tax=Oryzias melastigma TaxID=30732 RepID=A0A3B3D7K5_ORYME